MTQTRPFGKRQPRPNLIKANEVEYARILLSQPDWLANEANRRGCTPDLLKEKLRLQAKDNCR